MNVVAPDLKRTSHRPFSFLWGPQTSDSKPWDQVLFETDRFVVVPSVGALVAGWVLVIPRVEVIAVGALDAASIVELEPLKDRVIFAVQRAFGSAAVFEHGPVAPGLQLGCSVDHAHLHILPAPCSLLEEAIDFQPSLAWHQVEGLRGTSELFQQSRSYLYVEQPRGCACIADAELAPSQFFRRIIARHLGIPSKFDWRTHPMTNNVYETVARLRSNL